MAGATVRRLSLKRAAVIGFIVGFLITLPVLVLALLTPVGETLLPILVLGSLLLRPLTDAMASWPGAVNVLLTAIVNGLVYAVVLAAISRLIPGRGGGRSRA
jgi:Flp pilus assembly protein TadB